MTKEFCAENFTLIPAAIEAGANRIELCDNLSVGGTTPSYGVIKKALEYCQPLGVTNMVMIRPRGGNFEYNADEIEMMKEDIQVGKSINVDGFVLGCLKGEWIDEESMKSLLSEAGDTPVVFHMAFDAIQKDRQVEAVRWLSAHGVTRILTHGGIAGTPIEENFDHLRDILAVAKEVRIEILVGGGVTASNAEGIMDAIEVDQLHGTKIVSI